MHYFLSPHLDDIALSCGGYVRRLVQRGERVVIVTVCTGDWPTERPLTPAIQKEHSQWKLGEWPYRARRLEDDAATKVLGAYAVHLGLPDAIYRFDAQNQPMYVRDFIGVPPNPEDWKEHAIALAAKLTALIPAEAHIYCPLAVGRHVDHSIVRQVVEVIYPRSRITYYEDYPYADQPVALATETAQLPNAQSKQIELTVDELDTRIAAVACYASQVPVMFGTNVQMAERIRAYATNAGGERFWTASLAP